MGSTTQIARDAEASRAELAATLAELRERLSPDRLKQDAVRAVRQSGPVRFAAGLGRDASNSAVPMALLAAGALWAMSNTKGTRRARPAPGSVGNLVELVDAVISAAATVARTAGRAAKAARTNRPAALHSAKQTQRAFAEAPGAVAETGSRLAGTARKAIDDVQAKSVAAMNASADMAASASRSVRAASTVASKDPVFIAGLGIAAAGIAAAVFGISRQRAETSAASALVHAAEAEAEIAPRQSAFREGSEHEPDATGLREQASLAPVL